MTNYLAQTQMDVLKHTKSAKISFFFFIYYNLIFLHKEKQTIKQILINNNYYYYLPIRRNTPTG